MRLVTHTFYTASGGFILTLLLRYNPGFCFASSVNLNIFYLTCYSGRIKLLFSSDMQTAVVQYSVNSKEYLLF